MSVLFLGLDCTDGGTSASTSKKYHQNSNSSTHHYQHIHTRGTLPLYWCGWVNKNINLANYKEGYKATCTTRDQLYCVAWKWSP